MKWKNLWQHQNIDKQNQWKTLKEMKEKWIKSDKSGNDTHLLNTTKFLGFHHEQRLAFVST
jgi:hypothetical protein